MKISSKGRQRGLVAFKNTSITKTGVKVEKGDTVKAKEWNSFLGLNPKIKCKVLKINQDGTVNIKHGKLVRSKIQTNLLLVQKGESWFEII